MIRFDYHQLPLWQRRSLCHSRLLSTLEDESWVDMHEIESIYLRYYAPSRYPSDTYRRLHDFLYFMENRHLIQLRVLTIGGKDVITHARRIRHVPGHVQWRPRRPSSRPRPEDH